MAAEYSERPIDGWWAPAAVALALAWSVIESAAAVVVLLALAVGLALYTARPAKHRSRRGGGLPPPFIGDGGGFGSSDGGLDGGGLDGGGLDGGGLGAGGFDIGGFG